MWTGEHVALHVWRSERADGLIDPLADLLGRPPADPFAVEAIAVPTAGIERWLTQELSLRLGTADGATDGVCANVDFPFPGSVIGTALAAAGGLPADDDVWRPTRLTWALLSLLAAQPDADWWGPARSHLASPDDGRRYAAARRLADLFDRYAVHRPEMVRSWVDEDDRGPGGDPIDPLHAWQPALWRQLRAHVGTASTAERLGDAVAQLRAGDVELDLPERLSVFGLTALPSSYLRVLGAIAEQREVHLFLLHPSPTLWDGVEAHIAEHGAVRGPREDDATAELARHPLLRSWGRDSREMQTVFAALGARDSTHRPIPEPAHETLLSRIQADIRADRLPPGPPIGDDAQDVRVELAAGDRSLQVHASHGRMRQVQVLRDAIMHLLAEDEDLEPRDIIVMCPDVESFAPYIDAVFGAQVSGDDDATTLRVRIADRSLRQTNPMLKVVADLLDLADSRLTGSEVIDLLGRGPVRRRFRFDDADLERIETWVPDLGIRWGLDAADRGRFDLAGVAVNTWSFGLQRLLTGVAIADEDQRLVVDTVPYDDVEGSDVELAGRLAECVTRLTAVLTELREKRPLDGWREVIVAAADRLTATSTTDAWQRQQLNKLLDDLVGEADHVTDATELTLAEVRVLLGDRLRGRPTRASHRTGDLTVSTLVPMRAVPHKVVCLLGMDDGSFPRKTVPDGDDLVDLVPFVGDRDARTEDRQLLLDALLAATDHLVITYSGRDDRSNEPLPPSVPVGELLDVIDATARPPAGDGRKRARDRIVVSHPLQPFDRRNYVEGALGTDGPWSFDGLSLQGALAKAGSLGDPAPFLSDPLEPPEATSQVVELNQLVGFLEHPTKAFLSERLGVWFPSSGDGPQDGIPLDLTGLPQWGVGDRLLRALLDGHTREAWEQVERARGTLPPEPLAANILEDVCPVVEDIVAADLDMLGDTAPRAIDLDVPIGDHRRLIGTVAEIRDDAVAFVSYSSMSAKHRLAAYARLVALTAGDPSVPWRAVLIHRKKKTKKNVEYCILGPLAEDADGRAEAARTQLATLVDLYDRGMRAPAPLYTDTSEVIARKVTEGRTAWDASGTWETSYKYPNDDLDPCHVAVLGRVATFAELLDEPTWPDEVGDAWPDCEERVVAWARRLWEPVIAIEDGGAR
jgi:exodeoxyribonuclease V gamma subunit